MNLCGSELRFAFGSGGPQIIKLAADAGFDGIAMGSACGSGDVAPLIAAAVAVGLVVPVVAAPLGDGPPVEGRRLPYLAALDDSDERRAALALFDATVEASVSLGVKTFTIAMGEVPLGVPEIEVARRFARRELDDDGPGARALAAAIGERRARSGAYLDACRTALDRIVKAAERRAVHVAIEMAGDLWRGPSPREAMLLLEEYRNGPVGVVWDEARAQALEVMGVGPTAERRTTLMAAALVFRANESVGLEVGYLPGLGDPLRLEAHKGAGAGAAENAAATDTGRPALSAAAPVIVTGRRDSTFDEVARARTLRS